jgi:hypothetical protein
MISLKHQNPDVSSGFARATVALALPSKDTLIEMIEMGTSVINLSVGVANVHPKDEFVKKIGREVALGRMSSNRATLVSVTMRGKNRVVFNFVVNVLDSREFVGNGFYQQIEFGVSYIPESSNTRLEYLVVEAQ